MTAVERIHHAVYEHGVHPGSDLAISDADGQEIHRVLSFVSVSNAFFYYRTDCGRTFLLQSEARSLSSGFPGDRCHACWKHLPVASSPVDALRQAAVNELMAMVGRLDARPGVESAHYRRDCWGCLAELLMGSHVEEVAHTLVLSAGHWLEGPVAA